jgi:hypothetical protein
MVFKFREKQKPNKEGNMGDTPHGINTTIEFDCQFQVELERSDFSSIMKVFLMLLPRLMEDFFRKCLPDSANTRCPSLRSRLFARNARHAPRKGCGHTLAGITTRSLVPGTLKNTP